MFFCRVLLEESHFVDSKGLLYKVPEYLVDYVDVGSIVYVPLGRNSQIKKGFVIEFEDFYDEDAKNLKEIYMVHHIVPILDRELIEFAEFIANHYASPLYHCLKLMVPSYFFSNPFIKFYDPLKKEYIQFDKKNIQTLATLCQDGKLGIIEHSPGIEKQEVYYGLCAEALEEIDLSILKKTAPKQYEILEILSKHKIISRNDLLDMLGNVKSSLNSLLKKNFIIQCNNDLIKETDVISIKNIPLTSKQRDAFNYINELMKEKSYHKVLLNGVTGSGKTLVYEYLIDEIIQSKKQILLLVPEITLSEAIYERLKEKYNDKIALFHSQLTPKERFDIFKKIRSNELSILIGPRSAMFMPFAFLDLIIIDEEHDSSYKQSDQEPRFHTIACAEYLAQKNQCILLLGSATPSIETLYETVQKKCFIYNLPDRVNQQVLPFINIIDMKLEKRKGNYSFVGKPLKDAMTAALSSKKQVILLLNKKGYASSVQCQECGEVIKCPRCEIPLTYYQSNEKLKCNYCEFEMRKLSVCPHCHSSDLKTMGEGTEKIVEYCQKHFPDAACGRLDGEISRNHSKKSSTIEDFKNKKIDILIGTQILAKGLDFSNIACVGVINADILLNLPDYRSAEKCFQLMLQVAGRAGRDDTVGQVFIQTYQPEHYVYQCVKNYNMKAFFKKEMQIRSVLNYPPLVYLGRIIVSNFDMTRAKFSIDSIYQYINSLDYDIIILGPSLAPVEKINNRYRYHLILKSRSRQVLNELMHFVRDNIKLIKLASGSRVLIDLDPDNIL